MLFQMPNDDVLYAALVARDPSYDGRMFVCVKSTGIFCRLTCPARKPKPENCQFFETVAECLDAGYRACKRCHPLHAAGEGDAAVSALLKALDDAPDHKWGEGDIVELGFDPSTVRRSFKRNFGITFLEMARMRRIRDGFTTLTDGGRVIDAQLDAGFASPSAFRSAFAKLLGASPARFTTDAYLRADWIDTPLGPMIAVSDKSALHLLEFADRKALSSELKRLRKNAGGHIGVGRFAPTDLIEKELDAFFAGQSDRFTVPLGLHGSDFTKTVWHALRNIPVGTTRSYREIAAEIGRPTAMRAVARANGANQIAIVIPCHRVIGADGSLTGYGGGLWRKQKLIDLEKQYGLRSEP